ncbi:zinc-binding domain-containing protein [Aureococcus anophagefferens]|nr:zinc-binding domain-containing protein [Aureococcus anophagefferens]
MFDGMRYVPVLLRGEVALLKEVPEDDVASSTCTERYGKRGPGASFDGGSRTSRGTRETGRRASDASAISEEESESDDEGESVHVSQDGLGPAETEAERRERLRAEFFAEIAAAASRRALRRLLYKSTRDRHSISKSKQLGLCTVGPGGIVLELAMLNAAYESPSNPMTDWSDATFFGQKRGSARKSNLQPDFNARLHGADDDAHGGGLDLALPLPLFNHDERAPFTKDVSEWVLTLPTAAAIRDMLVTQEMWKNFRSNLVEDVLAASPRASNRDRVEASRREPARHNGTAVSKRVALFMGAEANRAKAEEKVPAVLKKAQGDLAEKQSRGARDGLPTHQFRPNVKGAPSAHQVALKLSIAPKDQLQCYPELVDDLPTPFAVARPPRASASAADVNQTARPPRDNALVKRKTTMASHGITNHRMTQKRESTLH